MGRVRPAAFFVRGEWSLALEDDGVGFEGGPGEPEVVAVDDGLEFLASQGAFDGLAQDVPGAAGLVVDDVLAVKAEG